MHLNITCITCITVASVEIVFFRRGKILYKIGLVDDLCEKQSITTFPVLLMTMHFKCEVNSKQTFKILA